MDRICCAPLCTSFDPFHPHPQAWLCRLDFAFLCDIGGCGEWGCSALQKAGSPLTVLSPPPHLSILLCSPKSESTPKFLGLHSLLNPALLNHVGIFWGLGKVLDMRGTEVPEDPGGLGVRGREGEDRDQGTPRAGLVEWAQARWSRPLVARAQPIRVQAGLGHQVVGVGAGAGVCVGRKGLGPVGTPRDSPEAPAAGNLGPSGSGAEKPRLLPPRLSPPPPARSRPPPPGSGSSARAPVSPSAAEGRAPLPAPPPAAPSPRPPSARCSRGAPARPHPRRPSVERRAAGARGERGASRWSGRRGPGPGWGRGTGSRRGSLSP